MQREENKDDLFFASSVKFTATAYHFIVLAL